MKKTGLNFKVEYCLFLDITLWGAQELALFMLSSAQSTRAYLGVSVLNKSVPDISGVASILEKAQYSV